MILRPTVTFITAAVVAVLPGGCVVYHKIQDVSRELEPYRAGQLTDEQQIALIDDMRAKGSYDAARDRLTATARAIANRIVAAVPGQTWKFNADPEQVRSARNGLTCKQLSSHIARRPVVNTIAFGTVFSAEEFVNAAGIVREEAAAYGAVTDNSLFNEPSQRDYSALGNGYEFNIGQMKFATLNIHGDCFLRQQVLDLPPGQLPPQPPIVPASPTR